MTQTLVLLTYHSQQTGSTCINPLQASINHDTDTIAFPDLLTWLLHQLPVGLEAWEEAAAGLDLSLCSRNGDGVCNEKILRALLVHICRIYPLQRGL